MIKLRNKLIFIVFGLIILLGAITLVSAGWFGDLFKDIFGRDTTVQGTQSTPPQPMENISPQTIQNASLQPNVLRCKVIEYGNFTFYDDLEQFCRSELDNTFSCTQVIVKEESYYLDSTDETCSGSIQVKTIKMSDYSSACNEKRINETEGGISLRDLIGCTSRSCSEMIFGEIRNCVEPALGDIYNNVVLPVRVTCCQVVNSSSDDTGEVPDSGVAKIERRKKEE